MSSRMRANGVGPSDWGPRLVRFYYFICADKAAAEAAAIETLAAADNHSGSALSPVKLSRRAIMKAAQLPSGNPKDDWIAQGLLRLAEPKRVAVALAHGMNLGPDELSEALNVSPFEARRLLTDGLFELQRILTKTDQRNSCET